MDREIVPPAGAGRIGELLDAWETRFGPLVADAGLVMWVASPRLECVLCVSSGFQRVWDCPAGDVVSAGMAWPPRLHPDDRGVVESMVDRLSTTGRDNEKYRIVLPDGGHRWIHDRASLVCDEKGRALHAVGLAEEVTSSEATRNALHARTEELAVVSRGFASYLASGSWQKSALELVAGALELTGSRLGFFGAVVPEGGLRLLAWSGDGWDGAPCEGFFVNADGRARDPAAADLPEGEDLASQPIREGRTVIDNQPEGQLAAHGLPRGHPPLTAFIGVPVMGDDRVIGLIGLANRPGGYGLDEQRQVEVLAGLGGVLCQAYLDHRKRRRLEEELRHSQRMEAVGRLAGGVAHDFNNLLQVINGYSDLLLEMVGHDAALKDIVERVRRAGGRAGSLTRQLLAFSRRQVLEPRTLDPADLVAEAQKMFMRLIGEDIEVRVERPPRAWPVHADPGQLEQVLMNLVVNARDAMPDGGRIVIETANVTRPPAEAAEAADDLPAGRYVRLSVSDTGHGIPPAVLPHIFEPFFTTKAEDRGTGLGLSTVHGIVVQSGGHLRVQSETGKGAAFHVYLPVAEGPVQPAAEVQPQAKGGTGTVLLVEDEEDIRVVCRRMLEHAGYTVLLAPDPHAALETLSSYDGPIHLLLTDVVMPGGSGPALVSQMRPLRPGTAVVYMSGYTEHASLRSGLIEPGAYFLHKPFDRRSLLGTLERALAGQPDGRREARAAVPRALVVDDALMNRELMQAMVKKLGWSCEAAAGGEQALALLQAQSFDLVFLDCRMPAPDGYETVRRVRAREPAAVWKTAGSVPVVGVSAELEPGQLERCVAAGMNDYIPKPVALEDLARAIKRWYCSPGQSRATGGHAQSELSERLRSLERELGRVSVQRFARLFLADLSEKRTQLRLAVSRADAAGLVAAAHAVRGSCVNLGGRALAELCTEIEVRARSSRLEDMGELLRRFEQEADLVQIEVSGLVTG